MLEWLNGTVIWLAEVLPLELFVFVGSFIEEIVAPIPSVVITVLAGSLALASGYGYAGLVFLALLAAFGKSFACAIIYIVADKAEDFLMERVGPALGITHADIERVGRFFTGSMRDYFILILIRALPISPSLPISVLAGIIKMPFTMYNTATFIGNTLRSFFFIFVGYSGFSAYQDLLENSSSLESLIQYGIAAALALVIGYLYLMRRRREKPDSAGTDID